MNFLEDGNVDYSPKDVMYFIKNNIDISNIYMSSENYTNEFNDFLKIMGWKTSFDFSKKIINHEKNQQTWFYPEEYKDINIKEYVLSLCDNDIQKNRVLFEMDIFEKNKLEKMLIFITYLVNFMRENNIVWGVGRGSSVCSYVLFLIGIHKIDSIKYNLDFTEFLG